MLPGPAGLATSLRFRLGLAEREAAVCERWLVRAEIGMTVINQLGLMRISEIFELTRLLSKIGGSDLVLQMAWSELRAQFFVQLVLVLRPGEFFNHFFQCFYFEY